MIKILICDTDHSLSSVLSHSLKSYGLEVDCLDNSWDLIPILKKKVYDVLVCSTWLGNDDGYSVCQTVREESCPGVAAVPILLLTFEVPTFEEFQFLSEKNIHYLTKYKSPGVLYDKILMIHNRSL